MPLIAPAPSRPVFPPSRRQPFAYTCRPSPDPHAATYNAPFVDRFPSSLATNFAMMFTIRRKTTFASLSASILRSFPWSQLYRDPKYGP